MEINELRDSFLLALGVFAHAIKDENTDAKGMADLGLSLSQIEKRVGELLSEVKKDFRKRADGENFVVKGAVIKGTVEVKIPRTQYELGPKESVRSVRCMLGDDRIDPFFNQKLSVPHDLEERISEIATSFEKKYLLEVLVQKPSKPRVSFKSK